MGSLTYIGCSSGNNLLPDSSFQPLSPRRCPTWLSVLANIQSFTSVQGKWISKCSGDLDRIQHTQTKMFQCSEKCASNIRGLPFRPVTKYVQWKERAKAKAKSMKRKKSPHPGNGPSAVDAMRTGLKEVEQDNTTSEYQEDSQGQETPAETRNDGKKRTA